MGIKIKVPFQRLSWYEAMSTYGSDKPDLRFELKIQDITNIFLNSDIKIFKETIEKNGVIKCLKIEDSKSISRKDLDELVLIAKNNGAGGLIWIKVDENLNLQSPIAKFLKENEKDELIQFLDLKKNNLLLITSDNFLTASSVLGIIRNQIALKLNLINTNEFNFLWIYDFPLFEWDEKEKRYKSVHHPFTMPSSDTIEFLIQIL